MEIKYKDIKFKNEYMPAPRFYFFFNITFLCHDYTVYIHDEAIEGLQHAKIVFSYFIELRTVFACNLQSSTRKASTRTNGKQNISFQNIVLTIMLRQAELFG